jgi:hypothetical protein
MPTPEKPSLDEFKRLFFEKSLEFGEVGIRFLPELPGIAIPPFLDCDFPIVFNYGLHMARPIPDLELSDRGISATLAFGSEFHKTFIPWNAIIAMGGINFGIVFPLVALETPEEPKKPKLRIV